MWGCLFRQGCLSEDPWIWMIRSKERETISKILIHRPNKAKNQLITRNKKSQTHQLISCQASGATSMKINSGFTADKIANQLAKEGGGGGRRQMAVSGVQKLQSFANPWQLCRVQKEQGGGQVERGIKAAVACYTQLVTELLWLSPMADHCSLSYLYILLLLKLFITISLCIHTLSPMFLYTSRIVQATGETWLWMSEPQCQFLESGWGTDIPVCGAL